MLVAILAVALIAGCGSGGDTAGGSGTGGAGGGSNETTATAADGGKGDGTATTPEFVGSFPPAGIEIGTPAGVGPVIVDTAHKTLYRFSKDTQGSGKSSCYGRCAELWRPVPSGGKPRVRGGAESSLTGTLTRDEGLIQATYDDWPLYTYIKEYGEKTHGAKTVFGGDFRPLRADGSVVEGKFGGG